MAAVHFSRDSLWTPAQSLKRKPWSLVTQWKAAIDRFPHIHWAWPRLVPSPLHMSTVVILFRGLFCGLHLTSSVLGIKSKDLSLWHPNSKTFFLLLFFIYCIWPVYFICGLNYALTTYCSTYKQQPSHLSSQIHSHKQTASPREAGIMPI